MNKRVLIIGGYGMAGRLLTKHLLEETNADLIIAGRSLGKAEACKKEIANNSPRLSTRAVDATDAESLRVAVADVDLVLNAAPTSHHTELVIRVLLNASKKVDYLDLQLSKEKMTVLNKFAPELDVAGQCVITEAGFHPGLPSAMVRYAETHMDTITSAKGCGYLNMGKQLPYTEAVDELLEVFRVYQGQVYKNGAWTKPGSWDMQRFDLGEAIGERLCYSMYLEELLALPELYPTLKEVGFYMAGSGWLVDFIVFPIVMLGLQLAPRTLMRPLGKFLCWGMQQSPPPYVVALQVDAMGQSEGRNVGCRIRLEHFDGYEMTVIPVVAFLKQYLDGSARKPGLHLMGQLAEPKRLFQDMERMGIRVIMIETDDE
jgi:hypothetical protein